jgi:hypothetical protein
MRKCMTFCGVCAAAALLANVALADNGLPSLSKMQQMGLSGTTIVSDSAAMGVRGMGWTSARAWGSSKIKVNVNVGPVSVELKAKDGHDIKGEQIAVGGNLSFVIGAIGAGGSGGNFGVAGFGLFAGGLSGGYAQ